MVKRTGPITETEEQRQTRLARRDANLAERQAEREARIAAHRDAMAEVQRDVDAARAALLAFDRSPQRQRLIDAFREARERLADVRHPKRSRERAPMPRGSRQ